MCDAMLTEPAHNTRGSERQGRATTPPRLEIAQAGDTVTARLTGSWLHETIAEVYDDISALGRSINGRNLIIELGDTSGFDTAGAWLTRSLARAAEGRGMSVSIEGDAGTAGALVRALPVVRPLDPQERAARRPLFQRLFHPVGRGVYELADDFVAAMYILGSAVRGAQLKLNRAAGISPAAIVTQVDHMGVRAVPIIALMSFLIGAIIAQQGAFQLRYFGAEIFVVDLVGILQLREVGVLLTAIMIAGRSGSAITAEIGSMKMREEVDALKVMGLSPIGVLVFPRLVALTFALPLLTIVANFAALAGAAFVAWFYSGITPEVFLTRLRSAIDFSTIISGMIKAPFMALIIGIVAAVEGLKVGGSAESLGRRVTASVVKAIFFVILVDGIFAIFYASIDF